MWNFSARRRPQCLPWQAYALIQPVYSSCWPNVYDSLFLVDAELKVTRETEFWAQSLMCDRRVLSKQPCHFLPTGESLTIETYPLRGLLREDVAQREPYDGSRATCSFFKRNGQLVPGWHISGGIQPVRDSLCARGSQPGVRGVKKRKQQKTPVLFSSSRHSGLGSRQLYSFCA